MAGDHRQAVDTAIHDETQPLTNSPSVHLIARLITRRSSVFATPTPANHIQQSTATPTNDNDKTAIVENAVICEFEVVRRC